MWQSWADAGVRRRRASATRRPRKGVTGFSLIELMVTLSVMAVLLGLAAPSMLKLVLTRQANLLTHELITSINLARSEAIKRNSRVVLCKSSDGASCVTAGSWDQGWILFQDANNNALIDLTEVVLRRQNPANMGVTLTGNANVANYLSMSPSGMPKLISGAFQAGTLSLCTTPATEESSRQIVLSLSGRARVQTGTLSSCP